MRTIESQKVILLSNSSNSNLDWENKHDPSALLYLNVDNGINKNKSLETKTTLRTTVVNLAEPEQAAMAYIKAISSPDTILYLTPTALWRKTY